MQSMFRSCKNLGTLSVSRAPVQGTNPRKYIKRGVFETVYEVENVMRWSVLWLKGQYVTKLRICENRRSKEVKFKLISSDIMKDFNGAWYLQPCTQAGLNKLYGKGGHNPFAGLVGMQCLPLLFLFNKQHRCCCTRMCAYLSRCRF